jgi:4-amino-4-deoxychorismate lyase
MAEFRLFTSIRYDPLLVEAPKHGDLSMPDWNRKESSPWYMLDYHRDRMLKAAVHFGWTTAVQIIDGPEGLKNLEDLLEPFTRAASLQPHRVKILLDEAGNLTYESGPVGETNLKNLFPPLLPVPNDVKVVEADNAMTVLPKQPEYEVYIDSELSPPTAFTHHKTTKRQIYDAARRRHALGMADPKEVLLVNPKDGSVMEGSITTPYFWRGGRWVTPPVSQRFREGRGSGGNDGTTRRWALERSVLTTHFLTSDHAKTLTLCPVGLPWRSLLLLIVSCLAKNAG